MKTNKLQTSLKFEVLEPNASEPIELYLADIEVEFFEKYYSLKLRFPDGSFRQLWISQNTRLPKLGKAR